MQHQTLTDEDADVFFKVTVGRYYTASGKSPQIEGVKADITIPTFFAFSHIGERYLQYPLSSDKLSGELFHSLMNKQRSIGLDNSFLSIPYLKPRETEWRLMLESLKKNSEERLIMNHARLTERNGIHQQHHIRNGRISRRHA